MPLCFFIDAEFPFSVRVSGGVSFFVEYSPFSPWSFLTVADVPSALRSWVRLRGPAVRLGGIPAANGSASTASRLRQYTHVPAGRHQLTTRTGAELDSSGWFSSNDRKAAGRVPIERELNKRVPNKRVQG